MEDVLGKLKEKITSKLGDQPEARFNTIRSINKAAEELSEEKHFTEFLKDKKQLQDIHKLIKNKKLSNNQIKNKIKEFLKDPEDLQNFFKAILDSNKKKKEENKEAMGASSAGAYVGPLFSTTKGDIVKGVKTVREEVLKGGKADKMSLNDIAKKHKISISSLQQQYKKGLKVEKEHSDDKNEIDEIIKDHLFEDPKYYDKLKKVETKEATSSSSSGQFSQPAIWAKSMSKKNWKGASTKYMPGAKRVQVKKKCKTFPYCNQGDISALKIFENETVKKAVDSVSSKYGIDKDYIFGILSKQIGKTIK